jgi:hypothetical protein
MSASPPATVSVVKVIAVTDVTIWGLVHDGCGGSHVDHRDGGKRRFGGGGQLSISGWFATVLSRYASVAVCPVLAKLLLARKLLSRVTTATT